MRPEPADVVAQVLAALGRGPDAGFRARQRRRSRRDRPVAAACTSGRTPDSADARSRNGPSALPDDLRDAVHEVEPLGRVRRTSQAIGQHAQGVVGADRRDALRREREDPRQLRVRRRAPARAPCRAAPGARQRTRPSTAGSGRRRPRHARRVPSRHPIVPRSAPMARAEARSRGTVARAPTCPPSRAARTGERRPPTDSCPRPIRYDRPAADVLAVVPEELQQLRFASTRRSRAAPRAPAACASRRDSRAACA